MIKVNLNPGLEDAPKFIKQVSGKKSLISFIIPTLSSRQSLASTLESITHQTVQDYEALVGIDNALLNVSGHIREWKSKFNNSRFKIVHVNSISTNRGECGNGAGEIRNILVKNYSTSIWVGFVDDDDAVDSDYIKFLYDAINFDKNVDIVIFRMRLESGILLPLRRHIMNRYVIKNYVGISFAVRRALFLTPTKHLEFKASCTEDYDLIRDALGLGYNIVLSNCIAYHVRPFTSKLEFSAKHKHCIFNKLERAYDVLTKRGKLSDLNISSKT
jgi:glycosyltransferase involved in cell wall biosynthesis